MSTPLIGTARQPDTSLSTHDGYQIWIIRDKHNRLSKSGISEHFITVGTHALFAYESACGVRFVDAATTTQDIDLWMDTQKHLLLASTLEGRNESLLSTPQKVDPTFGFDAFCRPGS